MNWVLKESGAIPFYRMTRKLNTPASDEENGCNSQIEETVDQGHTYHGDPKEMRKSVERMLMALSVVLNAVHRCLLLIVSHSVASGRPRQKEKLECFGHSRLVYI